jgi:transcription elongation GreA/GreB family factor
MSDVLVSSETVLRLREARDRLIDLLGLGETYPVRDLPVPNERLTVAFNSTAEIKVEDSEKQVAYGLRDKNGQAAGAPATGTGDTLTLTTPAIRDDITFTVHARTPLGREADLLMTATVKVGLDLTLDVAVLPADGPTPRVVDFGATVTVLIPASQDGVDYRLVRFPAGDPPKPDDMAAAANDDIVSAGGTTVRGTGGPIQLPSIPLTDDTVLRIRAIKIFDAALTRPPQTNLLAGRLPVFVRANPALAVAADPGPIYDFQAARFVRVGAAAAGVEYRALLCPVADAMYAQGAAPSPALVAVPVPGQPDALIRLPPMPSVDAGTVPPGFAVGADWQVGAGGDLRLALPPAAADAIVTVAARKTHVAESGTFVSTVWLRQQAELLVRPNPSPPLVLTVTLAGAATDGALAVAGGQPGVYYTPRTAPNGPPVQPPAYMHQPDPENAAPYKGVGQLKLEVDFAVARDGQPPLPPLLDAGAIPVGTTLAVQAMMAQSRIAIDLAAQAVIGPAVKATLQSPLVDFGGTAHVLVAASRAADSHALFREGTPADKPEGAPRDGNGQTLDFASSALTEDTVLVLAATSKAAIHVQRRNRLSVAVGPNPKLTVRPRDDAVAAGAEGTILVEASQPNVAYRLMAGAAPVGAAMKGTGATLFLPTGPIAATTTFSVTATRLLPPDAGVTLAQTAIIKLKT